MGSQAEKQQISETKAKPQLSTPKPVDYVQKALGLVSEQLVDKAAQEVHEVVNVRL